MLPRSSPFVLASGSRIVASRKVLDSSNYHKPQYISNHPLHNTNPSTNCQTHKSIMLNVSHYQVRSHYQARSPSPKSTFQAPIFNVQHQNHHLQYSTLSANHMEGSHEEYSVPIEFLEKKKTISWQALGNEAVNKFCLVVLT